MTLPQLSPQAWLAVLGVTLLFVLFSWWAIRDAMGRQFGSAMEKLVWVQVVALVPFLGAIIYLLAGRHRGTKNR